MKKFTFSLQPVLKVKKIQQEQKKGELAKIQNELDELYSEEGSLKQQMELGNSRYGDDLQGGMPASQVLWHCNYAGYIKDELKRVGMQIEEAEARKEAKQAELISVMKEVKTLEKLRQEQLKEYLEQAAKDEEKEIGDLISYNKTVNPGV
jgi:flagellar FliJ protein